MDDELGSGTQLGQNIFGWQSDVWIAGLLIFCTDFQLAKLTFGGSDWSGRIRFGPASQRLKFNAFVLQARVEVGCLSNYDCCAVTFSLFLEINSIGSGLHRLHDCFQHYVTNLLCFGLFLKSVTPLIASRIQLAHSVSVRHRICGVEQNLRQ